MNMRVRGLLLAILMMVGSGCATTAYQTARTNGEGNFQFGIEPGIWGAASTEGLGGVFVPSFNLAGRYGLSDSVDLGARLGSMGYEVQAKIMLTDPAALDSLAMSLAPGVTAIGFGGGGAGFFILATRIPLLIGIPVGDSEFTLGPRISPGFFAGGGGGESAGAFVLSAGASAGFAARLGDKFWLMPEAGIDFPIVAAAAAGGESDAAAGFGALSFSAGVALLFGGRPRATSAPASAPPAME